jgi:integrase
MKQRDYLEWVEAENIIEYLIEDKHYKMGLFVLIGFMTGMRANDILALHWEDIMSGGILYQESSTGRYYQVNFSDETEEKVNKIYQELGKPSLEEYCFISKKKCVYSIQRINVLLKQVSQEYLRGEVLFTTSTLRRTFGREYLKRAGMSCLNTLGVFFNQDSEEFTMNYLRLYSNTLISLPRLCAVIRRQK